MPLPVALLLIQDRSDLTQNGRAVTTAIHVAIICVAGTMKTAEVETSTDVPQDTAAIMEEVQLFRLANQPNSGLKPKLLLTNSAQGGIRTLTPEGGGF